MSEGILTYRERISTHRQNLESLTLTSSHHLNKIENLDNLKNLRVLDLSDSNISEIEGLEELRNLEILRLGKRYEMGDNFITEIKGFDNLINLKEFQISCNGPFSSNSIRILESMRENGLLFSTLFSRFKSNGVVLEVYDQASVI